MRRFVTVVAVGLAWLGPVAAAQTPGGHERSPGPHVPEPLSFDLVRGLGARRGEVEANVLVDVRSGDHGAEVHWAPEVEWAPWDGVAFELELPHEDARLVAVKGAAQVTLPGHGPGFAHGVQLIGEHGLGGHPGELAALYVVGLRRGRVAANVLVGGEVKVPRGERPSGEALVEPSVFVGAHARVDVGVEANVAAGPRHPTSWTVLPQVHVRVTPLLKVQAGVGIGGVGAEAGPVGAVRVVLEPPVVVRDRRRPPS